MYHASPAIHAIEKKSTSRILVLFSFRVMTDHSRFCCPVTNPMNRPIPVPNRAPSPIAIRISNKLALIQTLLSGYPFPNINSPARNGPLFTRLSGVSCAFYLLRMYCMRNRIATNPATRGSVAVAAACVVTVARGGTGESPIVTGRVWPGMTVTVCSPEM